MYCANCGQPKDSEAGICPACGVTSPAEPGGGSAAVAETTAESAGALWEVPHVAAGAAALIGLLFVSSFVARLIADSAVGPGQTGTALTAWIAVHLVALAVGGLVWGLGGRRAQRPWRALGLGPPGTPVGMTALLALGTLALSLGVSIGYGLLLEATGPDLLRPPEAGEQKKLLFTGAAIVLSVQALALVTPLTEEVFFRGFVFGGLVPRLGAGPAIVLSSLVFAAFHFDPGVLVPIFVTGAAFAWLYLRTGSVWPCIAAHAAQNGLAILGAVLSA